MTELLAFVGIWMLWDFRLAATFALVVIVARALCPRPPAPAEPPVLEDALQGRDRRAG